MRILLALVLAIAPLQTRADPVVDRALTDVIMPGLATFADSTQHLAEVAQEDCTADSAPLRAAWNGAMDAWFGVQDLRLGPLEEEARRQNIAFWPDNTGHRPRALTRLLASNAIPQDAAGYAQHPVSVRGLYALEAMLYEPRFNTYGTGDPGCALVRAAAADLAALAAEVQDAWQADFAATLQTAGTPENTRFLTEREARQALFTALMVSLHFDIDERLGQPMGSFDKPRPLRAGGRLSDRAQRNLELSLAAHEALAMALKPDATETHAALERVRDRATALDDPAFAGAADPGGRFQLEALQTALDQVLRIANDEIGPALGVRMGLNSLDGD